MVENTKTNVDLQVTWNNGGSSATRQTSSKTYDCLNVEGNYTTESNDSKAVYNLVQAMRELSKSDDVLVGYVAAKLLLSDIQVN